MIRSCTQNSCNDRLKQIDRVYIVSVDIERVCGGET